MSSKKLNLDFSAITKKANVPDAADAQPQQAATSRERRKAGRKPKKDKVDTYTLAVPKSLQQGIRLAAALSGLNIHEWVERVLTAAVDKAGNKVARKAVDPEETDRVG